MVAQTRALKPANSMSGLADWFASRGVRRRLSCETATTVHGARFLYLDEGLIQIDFTIEDGRLPRQSAALFFEHEVLDVAAMRFLPRSALRALGRDAHYIRIDDAQLADTHVPIELTDRIGAFTGRLARQMIASSTLDIDERLCTLLVKLGLRIGARQGGCIQFDLPMSRDAMAAVLGVRSESLSRAMTRIKTSGLIKLHGRSHVTVPDWDALCARSPIANLVIAANR